MPESTSNSQLISPSSNGAKKLLVVSELQVEFRAERGIVNAVNGISFDVRAGETIGIIGESGSGKTVSMLAIMGLIPSPPGFICGSVQFEGQDLFTLNEGSRRKIRGSQIAMVFQDPLTSLNPVLTIGQQVSEMYKLHKNLGETASRQKAIELLDAVGIPDANRRYNDYPHRLSGGMRQRVMIAIGIACHPKLLIADEPTTALDVTIQAQILQLVKKLKADFGMSIIWITHDFGVIAGLADRVIVMYAGNIVEIGQIDEIFYNPRHPYTIGLLRAVPRLDEESPRRLEQIEGSPPLSGIVGDVCCFHLRCRFAIEKCHTKAPPFFGSENGEHRWACWIDLKKEDTVIVG